MVAGLKPYPEYQPTAIKWLEGIPSGWEIRRAKGAFTKIDVRSKTGKEELLTVSSSSGVVPRSQKNVTMFKAKSYVGHKLCWPGDLVVNSLWAWMQGLGVARHHGMISSAYSVYRPRRKFDNYGRYFHYLLRSAAYKWELQTRSKGVWLSRLQLADLAFMDMPMLFPPRDEQTAIVRFLDHANHRLEKAIRAKQKIIKLLNEQKQVIIHRAVTRGLDPNVRLKPSGLDWLGEIPEHWDVPRLRRLCDVVDCKHLTVPFVEEGKHLASVRQVQSFNLNLAGAKRTTREHYQHLIGGGRKPRRGDLIYCRNVSVGACSFIDTDDDFAMGQDVCLIRCREDDSIFLNYFMCSYVMEHQLRLLLVGSTFNRINISQIKALFVIRPPVNEQKAIASYLLKQVNGIEKPVVRVQKGITLLQEYRARLIADVVTGKLDVREASRGLPDLDEDLDLPAEDADFESIVAEVGV